MDVDPDERGVGGRRDRQRGAGVVAEHVDPDRHVDGVGQCRRDGRHLRDDVFRNVIGMERRVAEVLEDDAVDAARLEPGGILECAGSDGPAVAVESRCAGERREVNHADNGAVGVESLRECCGRGHIDAGCEPNK